MITDIKIKKITNDSPIFDFGGNLVNSGFVLYVSNDGFNYATVGYFETRKDLKSYLNMIEF